MISPESEKNPYKEDKMTSTFRINNTEFSFKTYRMSCGISEFTINDECADEDDFVDFFDHSPASAPDYGCGDKCADIREPRLKVLKRYGLNHVEYDEIACDLLSAMSVGMCSMLA